MTRSSLIRNGAGVLFVMACMLGSTSAWAGGQPAREKLDQAVKAYEAENYEEARLFVREIDADALSRKDKKRFTQYIELTEFAFAQHSLAQTNLAQAGIAIDNAQLDSARNLLEQVMHNDFATSPLKEQARRNLATIDEAQSRNVYLAAGQAASSGMQTAETESDRVRVLIRRGRGATQRGDYQLARDFFEEALELIPGHPDAVRGLERVSLHMQVEGAPSTTPIRLIDKMQRRRAILWQRAVAAYRQAEFEILDSVDANRYKQANRALQFARETIEAGRQYAEPLELYESLLAEHATLADMVRNREQAYNEEKARSIREDLQAREKLRQASVNAERERQVGLLMEQVEQKADDADYQGAVHIIQQILVIDPKNVEASWLREKLEDKASVRRQNVARKRLNKESREVLIQAEEAKVPWHKEVNYPDNWLDITRSPYRQLPGEYPLDDAEGDFEESFRSRIPEISFNQLGLEQSLQHLAQIGDINVVPNWPDLALAGVTKDTPVTLQLKGVRVNVVLAEVLEQVEGGSSTPIGYAVRDGGIVKVATDDFLNREVFMRIYDVKDLIQPVENFNDAPEFDLVRLRDKRRRPPSKPSMFGNHDANNGNSGEPGYEEDDNELLTELVQLIKQHVAPRSWRSQGGAHATIHARARGNLVITQTATAHREVFNLLDQLREDDAVQIAIEARFLTVNSNFLEDMGVDLNIVLNNGNAGFDQGFSGGSAAFDPSTGGRLLLPRNFSRLGFAPATAPFGNALGGVIAPDQGFGAPAFVPVNRGSGNFYTPIPVTSNLRGFTDPSVQASDVPGSFAGNTLAPALQIAGSFLDNIQVDFLIRATQADARTSTLIAPKLIMTNGQQSWIAITEEQNFVSELDPVVASGAAAQRPIIDTLNTGAVLNVQATVSPDRRYVTMNLQPGVGRLVAVNTFQFSGGPITGVGAPGFVQLPIIQRQQVKTTVTVPDGGTLLIGGQKLTFESEKEAGVPVLSKIPILKRLYSSRAIIKDEQVLLILIKPQILIKEEQEELAHPTLGSIR